MFSRVIPILKGLLSYYLVCILIIVSLFTLIVDIPKLKENGFNKEAKIAKVISIIYIILGPAICIIIKVS